MASVKSKIRSGTIFLFVLLLLSGGFSIYYLAYTREASRNVLTANYESLEYIQAMQQALDSAPFASRFSDSFMVALTQQEANITEPGEREATTALRKLFTGFTSGDTSLRTAVATALRKVSRLNMQAIKLKNEAAESKAKEALTFLITIVSFIFVIGFTFVANFPSIVTTPLQKFTDAIKAIGKKEYAQRIHLQSRDEFGEMATAFNEMADRLEYFENSNLNKLIFEKTRAEAVINSLKDASIGIDKDEIVLFANSQALQLLGLQTKDIVGLKVGEVARRNDLFRHLLEEKAITPFKIVVDNRENYFTKERIDVTQGDSFSKVIVLKNITSFKELDVAKTNFIATVSHELKTPLAASDFSLKLLQDTRVGNLSDEQKELVQSLKADNQRMLKILSELLNMSQVEAGKIQLNIQAISPYDVVATSLQAVATPAREKGLQLEKILAQGLPALAADADKMAWVLTNFLTNAIRYSPPHSTIKIDVKPTDNALSFAVSDEGQGIDEAYLKRIFERYYQVPGRSDKNGSGIGLAVCKEFIEAMGGTIWVKSQLGIGSTFGFNLPTDKTSSEQTSS